MSRKRPSMPMTGSPRYWRLAPLYNPKFWRFASQCPPNRRMRHVQAYVAWLKELPRE